MSSNPLHPSANSARQELLEAISTLAPPPGWRVTMDVDPDTNHVRLQIFKKTQDYCFRWGRYVVPFLRGRWKGVHALVRSLEATTYEALLQMLRAHPHFFEFEVVNCGADPLMEERIRRKLHYDHLDQQRAQEREQERAVAFAQTKHEVSFAPMRTTTV